MPRRDAQQLNIRSAYARQRAQELARQTGRTVTEVVEEALRNYTPPAPAEPPPGLVRKGRLLVMPAPPGSAPITVEEVNAMIDAAREERADEIMNPPT